MFEKFGFAIARHGRNFAKARGEEIDDVVRVDRIQNAIHDEEMWFRETMAWALLGIGLRNKKLNAASVRAAKAIGPRARFHFQHK